MIPGLLMKMCIGTTRAALILKTVNDLYCRGCMYTDSTVGLTLFLSKLQQEC